MKKTITILICLVLLVSMLSACQTTTPTPTTAPAAGTTAAPAAGTTTDPTASPTEVPFDPMAKYSPEINITGARPNDASIKYNEGDTMENNPWTRAYKEELGINLTYEWIVEGSLYNQKISILMASNDLPDIIKLDDPTQFKTLQEADMIWDLTDIVEKYATPLTKKMLMIGSPSYKAALIDGKLYSSPTLQNPLDYAPQLWIRADWLKNVGLSEPKTMDELLAVAKAFTDNDPDQNQKNDTFGLALTKNLWESFAGLQGFSNGYRAYPTAWIKSADGNLVYGSIQPEMKAVLQSLQNMFKAGQIDKEFGVKDSGKVLESTTAGKVGIEFGAWWNAFWPLGFSKESDPKADWIAIPIPSIDGQPTKPLGQMNVNYNMAVNKKCQYPEALIKMLNQNWEKYYSTDPEEYQTFQRGPEGLEEHYAKLQYVAGNNVNQNPDMYNHVNEALKTKDPSKLQPKEKPTYDNILKFMGGDLTQWATFTCYGLGGSVETIMKVGETAGLVNNEYFSVNTPTMTEKGATLKTEEITVFTKLILGEPMESFDKFVADWKKLGGDAITAEVNEWYLKNK